MFVSLFNKIADFFRTSFYRTPPMAASGPLNVLCTFNLCPVSRGFAVSQKTKAVIKFSKIHRKTPVPESLFNEVADLSSRFVDFRLEACNFSKRGSGIGIFL